MCVVSASSPSETFWAVAADGPVGAEAAAEPSLELQVQEHLPLPGLQEQILELQAEPSWDQALCCQSNSKCQLLEGAEFG